MPYALIGLCDVTLVLIAGKLIFNVPIKGNLFCIYLAASFFILTCLGIGLFISSVSHTQSQAIFDHAFYTSAGFYIVRIHVPNRKYASILY
ncbi:MAG: ABC transporter permease, partial [Bacteroidales bacterium]|nr:ABC transporter permease [Bacteroidales bacterium]